MAVTTSIEGPDLGLASVCEPILRALPDWFGIEEAIVHYVEAIEGLPTFTAVVDGHVAGFISVKRHNDYSAEMYVLGVRPENHRRGIGRALVERVESWLHDEGVEFLQVKTVGPSRPCPSYDRTRAFYEAMGFRPLEEFKTLWNEANPCLVMVKRVGSQRQ